MINKKMKNKGLFILVLALLCFFPGLSCLSSSVGGGSTPETAIGKTEDQQKITIPQQTVPEPAAPPRNLG
jgi:hypothetical protein